MLWFGIVHIMPLISSSSPHINDVFWKGHTLVVLHEDILTVSSLFFRFATLCHHSHYRHHCHHQYHPNCNTLHDQWCPSSYHCHHHHIIVIVKNIFSLGLEHSVERLLGGWTFTSAEVLQSIFDTISIMFLGTFCKQPCIVYRQELT